MRHLYTVAIDPGYRGCGVALFANRDLHFAMYIEGSTYIENCSEDRLHAITIMVSNVKKVLDVTTLYLDSLVVEWPQVYQGGKQKGDPNDLLLLSAVAGGIAAQYPAIPKSIYCPREWKGQVKKDIMTKRILGHLSREELARVRRIGALDHNTIDAIGVGLFHFGRLGTRIYAP